MLAGGVESMSRAPFVLPKAQMPYDRRQATVYDTTIGWRFVNAALQTVYGTDSMPETAENVATDYGVSRADQDAFALRSQERAAKAAASGRFREEIVPVPVPRRSGDAMVETDEHPRETSLEALAALRPVVKDDGTVTAGNASGINDGAAALRDERESGRTVRRDTTRSDRGIRHCRCGSAGDGHRAGAGNDAVTGANRRITRRRRRRRDQRSLRRPVPRLLAAPWVAR